MPSATLQRVPAAPLQRVPVVAQPADTPTATAPVTNNNAQIVIPNRPNQPLALPPKSRNMHQYLTLTPAEIHKIPKPKFKCVGMQFVDDVDPQDTATGVVTGIVRHKKSNKLV